jgi:hypothetical protein
LPAARRARGYVAAPELPRAERGSSSHGDACHLQSCSESGARARAAETHDDPGAALSREGEPEPRGHMAAPELPRARSGSPSHGDTWHPQSYPQPGGGSRCLDLKLVRGVPGPQEWASTAGRL